MKLTFVQQWKCGHYKIWNHLGRKSEIPWRCESRDVGFVGAYAVNVNVLVREERSSLNGRQHWPKSDSGNQISTTGDKTWIRGPWPYLAAYEMLVRCRFIIRKIAYISHDDIQCYYQFYYTKFYRIVFKYIKLYFIIKRRCCIFQLWFFNSI